MEHSYTETSVRKKTTVKTLMIKTVLILLILALVWLSMLPSLRLVLVGAVAGGALLVWYWPRFKITWEYIFCDGQLDFDKIQGGEKRKNILRIEIEESDVVAPVDSERLAGYRHIPKRDFTSGYPDRTVYGVVTRSAGKGEEKQLLLFEPSEKMIDLMHDKCPNLVEKM